MQHYRTLQTKPLRTVYDALEANPGGLSESNIPIRIKTYGKNILPKAKKRTLLQRIISQSTSFFSIVLLGAIILSIILGERAEAFVIAFVLIANISIAVSYEYSIQNTIESLTKLLVSFTKVFRDGLLQKRESQFLVPGDVVVFEQGDYITADCRIIEASSVSVQESALTGESVSIEKFVLPDNTIHTGTEIENPEMLWMGTYITRGTVKALVIATGAQTSFGTITQSVLTYKRPTSVFDSSLRKILKRIGGLAMVVTGALLIISLVRGTYSINELLLFCVSALVSVVPEGLPVLRSIALARGAKHMARHGALVKDLSAIETVGAITTIITDKTGTLTQNAMTVEKIILSSGKSIDITGSGWSTEGNFLEAGALYNTNKDTVLSTLLKACITCNAAILREKDSKVELIGEPTEAALLVLARKAGLIDEKILAEQKVLQSPSFDGDKKYRTVLVQKGDSLEVIVIGAPEMVLPLCGIASTDTLHMPIQKASQDSYRTLAVATKKVSSIPTKLYSEVNGFTYLGTVAMRDPLRDDARASIETAQHIGIRVIMATGDHKNTAYSIGTHIGLITETYPDIFSLADTPNPTDEDLTFALKTTNIFARVTPYIKERLARILQSQNQIVAMTGDGVNDGPALKAADVGIAMGTIGTDVARTSSSLILLNDEFSAIIRGIKQGRLVMKNVRKTTALMLSGNAAKATILFSSLAIGLPLPLTAAQILWLNLITESIITLPLVYEKEDDRIFQDSPQEAGKLLPRKAIPLFILTAITLTSITFIIKHIYQEASEEVSRSMIFLSLGFSQIILIFMFRSFYRSAFSIRVRKNYLIPIVVIFSLVLQILLFATTQGRHFLELAELRVVDICIALGLGLLPFIVGEVTKLILSEKTTRTSQ